jgi:predicted nucleic acid-binding Zn ribbon protein
VSPVRRRRERRLTAAGTLLEKALGRSGFDPAAYPVFEIWDRILGPEAEKARAVGVKAGRLYVDVDNNMRMHELTLRKRSILRALQTAFGGRAPVSDIILRLGDTPASDDKHA